MFILSARQVPARARSSFYLELILMYLYKWLLKYKYSPQVLKSINQSDTTKIV